jgi:SpoVK/Ycf46/Vps4 family AAA+-type ATPase
MAIKNDEVAMLVRCAMEGDMERFRQAVKSIISNCRAKNKIAMANMLEQLLNKNSPGARNNFGMLSNVPKDLQAYINEVTPEKSFRDIVMSEQVEEACNDFVREHEKSYMLTQNGLHPRNRIILIGPPGNGKTSLSEAIAEAIGMQFYKVNYDSIIGSFLGETSAKIAKIFDYISQRKCVILFDELDILGKARSHDRDVGEMNRIVSTFLLRIDSLPNDVVMIGATNHHDFLDKALWRRFQVKIRMPAPDTKTSCKFIDGFAYDHDFDFGCKTEYLAEKILESSMYSDGWVSFSNIEEFCTSVLRNYYLDSPDADIESLINKQLNNFHCE